MDAARSAMDDGGAKRARSSADGADVQHYIPNECIVNIMRHLECTDTIPLAAVNLAWRSAAADAVQPL